LDDLDILQRVLANHGWMVRFHRQKLEQNRGRTAQKTAPDGR
jgi:hypothetical protein